MADPIPQAPVQRRRSVAGLIAGTALLVSLVALGIVIYGAIWQSTHAAVEVHLPAATVAGFGLAIAAIVAMIRSMSIWDLFEAVLETIGAVFALIAAIVAGILGFILDLFSW